MKIQKAHVVCLYPTKEQESFLFDIGGTTRFLYNIALVQRNIWGKRFKLNRFTQSKELTDLRKEVEWIKACPSQVLQQVLIDLDRAFSNFFSGKTGYPKFRKKSRGDSFRFPDGKGALCERLSKNGGRIKLPKLGWVRFRGWIDLPGQIRNVTVKYEVGRWYASIQYEHEVTEPPACILPAIGIDLGVVSMAAVSGQGRITGPNAYTKKLKKLKKLQKSVSRKKKKSNNRRKAVMRLAKLHQKIRRIRADSLHKLSHQLTKNHGTLVFEDLKIKNMTKSASGTEAEPGRNVRQKAGLNRSILDQGWGLFRQMCGYKSKELGGQCIDVSPRNTSRECRQCGHTSADNRTSQSQFRCVQCGHTENADDNASVVILKRAVGNGLLPVDALRRYAVEAGSLSLQGEVCHERRFDQSSIWYYGWDCSTGCIWNTSILKEL